MGPVLFPRRGWNGNGADFVSGLHSAQTFDSTVAGLPATGNQLRVDVVDFVDPDAARAPLRVDRVGVAWCDLFYARRFEPILDQLDFESPPTSGDDLYRIGPFDIGPDLPRVFDVTEPLRPLEVVGLDFRELSPGAWQLRFRPVEPGHRRYRVIADGPSVSGIVRPANADVVDAPTSSGLTDSLMKAL